MLNFQERELHRQKGLMNQTISVFDRKKCRLKNMEFSYCGKKNDTKSIKWKLCTNICWQIKTRNFFWDTNKVNRNFVALSVSLKHENPFQQNALFIGYQWSKDLDFYSTLSFKCSSNWSRIVSLCQKSTRKPIERGKNKNKTPLIDFIATIFMWASWKHCMLVCTLHPFWLHCTFIIKDSNGQSILPPIPFQQSGNKRFVQRNCK